MLRATTHGVLPYTGAPGRCRNMIVFGYEPQYAGAKPPTGASWMTGLRDETKELLQYAHITHTKGIATEWRRCAFLPPHSHLPTGSIQHAVATSRL